MLYLNETKLIEIFCDCDDFYKKHEQFIMNKGVGVKSPKANRTPSLEVSEIMAILILYHLTGMKCFQYYYNDIVKKYFQSYFPHLVSYNRFVELIPRCMLPFWLFINTQRTGKETGFYYGDSKKLPVCHNLRIYRNKVFKGIAGRSNTKYIFNKLSYYFAISAFTIVKFKNGPKDLFKLQFNVV